MAECFADGHLRFIGGAWRDDNGDVVEVALVVRCKECEYSHTTGCALDWAVYETTEESFCSYGKRKDG